MYLADRSRIMGMTSSVTAAMSSPKVVLMILRCRIVFCSAYDPNPYLFGPRLDIDLPLSDYRSVKHRCGKLCAIIMTSVLRPPSARSCSGD
jgi:hypothetical protein